MRREPSKRRAIKTMRQRRETRIRGISIQRIPFTPPPKKPLPTHLRNQSQTTLFPPLFLPTNKPDYKPLIAWKLLVTYSLTTAGTIPSPRDALSIAQRTSSFPTQSSGIGSGKHHTFLRPHAPMLLHVLTHLHLRAQLLHPVEHRSVRGIHYGVQHLHTGVLGNLDGEERALRTCDIKYKRQVPMPLQ